MTSPMDQLKALGKLSRTELIDLTLDLRTNLAGILAWIDHAKLQEKSAPHMPDESYLESARAAIRRIA